MQNPRINEGKKQRLRKEPSYSNQKYPASILVIDDDITLKPLYEQLLYSINPSMQLIWATTDTQAEFYLNENKDNRFIRYVITDIFLSGKNTGIDLWKKHADSRLKFIFTSIITKEKFSQYFYNEEELPLFFQKPVGVEICELLFRELAKTKRTA